VSAQWQLIQIQHLSGCVAWTGTLLSQLSNTKSHRVTMYLVNAEEGNLRKCSECSARSVSVMHGDRSGDRGVMTVTVAPAVLKPTPFLSLPRHRDRDPERLGLGGISVGEQAEAPHRTPIPGGQLLGVAPAVGTGKAGAEDVDSVAPPAHAKRPRGPPNHSAGTRQCELMGRWRSISRCSAQVCREGEGAVRGACVAYRAIFVISRRCVWYICRCAMYDCEQQEDAVHARRNKRWSVVSFRC
jgi:hypothetical protein